MPSKPIDEGFKVYMLATHDGYCLGFSFYDSNYSSVLYSDFREGPNPKIFNDNAGHKYLLNGIIEMQVMNILKPYLNKHHIVFMDSYYTST
jgi:hypothetical protein